MTATTMTVLLLSHIAAAVVGGWFWSLVQAGRRAVLDGRDELCAMRETFLVTHLGGPVDVPPVPSLLTATVAQAQVRLVELAARRDRERREFVDIMTTYRHRWSVAR